MGIDDKVKDAAEEAKGTVDEAFTSTGEESASGDRGVEQVTGNATDGAGAVADPLADKG